MNKRCIHLDECEFKELELRTPGGCNFRSFLKGVKFLPHSSAGDSVVIFGDVKTNVNKGVVLKVTFEPIFNQSRNRKKNYYDSTTIENLIYKHTIRQLFERCVTPHVIFPYGLLECSNVPNSLKNKAKYIDNSEYDKSKAYILMLEKIDAKTITHLGKINSSFENLKIMIFQILYTLECFIQVGLQHNDLHGGNIFVTEGDKPTDYYYLIPESDKYFHLKTSFCIKIFDFDRASKFSTKYNKKIFNNYTLEDTDARTSSPLSLCDDIGECNIKNDKFDAFKILYTLYTSYPQTQKFILQFVEKDLLFKKLSFPGLLCEEPPAKWVGNKKCKLIVPTDKQMKSVKYMLLNGFKEYEIKKEEIPKNSKIYKLLK